MEPLTPMKTHLTPTAFMPSARVALPRQLAIAWLAGFALTAAAQQTPFDLPPRASAPAVEAAPVAAEAPPTPAPRTLPARQAAVDDGPSPAARRAAVARIQARAANRPSTSEPALSCRTVHWRPGDIIRLHAQPYKQIHVQLPESGIDVIMGDKELWALDWINNRIFIKPTSRSSEGRATTISAIGQSGNAYEFLVSRVPEGAELAHCVYIVADAGLISRANWSKAESLGTDGSGAMVRELSTLRERNAELERQNREGLKAYRKKLNSNYAWESGAFTRWNGGEVESVYDDGRFTYVRVKDGAQGLLSIMAEIDGRATLLEYSYDAPTRTYQISGIFPKFTLRSGEQTMSVLRKGEGATS